MDFGHIKFLYWSNNKAIEEYISTKKGEISYVSINKHLGGDYLCLFIDYSCAIENLTNIILKHYSLSKETNKKIAIIALVDNLKAKESISQLSTLLSEIDKKNQIHRLIIVQDLYFLSDQGPITSFDNYINNVFNKKEIQITKKGDNFFFPISFDFLEKIILKALFLTNTAGKTFCVQGQKISDLNLGYLLLSAIEEINGAKIDINNVLHSIELKNNLESESIKSLSLLNINYESNLLLDINKYLKSKKENQNSDSDYSSQNKNRYLNKITKWLSEFKSRSNEKSDENLHTKIINKTLKFIEKIFAFVAISYLLATIIFISSAYGSLKYLEKSVFFIKRGEVIKSAEFLNTSMLLTEVCNVNYKLISPFINFFFKNLDHTNYEFLSFLNFSQTVIQSLNQIYVLTEKIFNSINNTKEDVDYESLILGLKSNLQQGYEYLNQLEIVLNKGDLPKPVILAIKQNLEFQALAEIKEQMGEISNSVEILPKLIGVSSVKNIFILIQNNHNVRSTGGTIDYIVQISMDRGRVVFMKNYQPLEIEKLDNFTLVPPPLIEKLTGESVWHLRDMNYNPDFPQTATNISWLLEKKLKIVPDIIISLNLSVFENLINKNSPLSKKIHSISGDEYTALLQKGEDGNTTKQVVDNFFLNLFNHQISIVDLISIFSESVNNRDLSLWASDINLEKSILTEEYSGSIRDYECHPAMVTSRLCISQTFHVNFSNFSNIPLNTYLNKKTTHRVTPNALSLEHEIIVDYDYLKNTPLTNRKLNEIVQIYLPKTANLDYIMLNNQNIPLSTVTAQDEATLTRFQLVISSNLNEKQKLVIKYTTPFAEKLMLPIAFTFTDLSQSGTREGNNLEIFVPELARASAITAEVQQFPGKIQTQLKPKKPMFGVNFVSKSY